MLDSARSKSADVLRRAADRACTSAAPGVLALSAAGDARDVWPLYLRPASLAPINSFSARRLPRTWAVTAARPGCTPSPTFGCSCVGAPTRTSTQSPRPGSTLSGRFAGCRTCAVTSRPAVGQRQRLRPRRAPRLARIASGRCWVATRWGQGQYGENVHVVSGGASWGVPSGAGGVSRTVVSGYVVRCWSWHVIIYRNGCVTEEGASSDAQSEPSLPDRRGLWANSVAGGRAA